MRHVIVSIMLAVPAVIALALEPVLAQPASAPFSPQQLSPVVGGTVVQYLMNHHGEVDGLLLSNGTQVHFPPHMQAELVAVAKPDDVVSVQGDRTADGPVVKAYAITNTHSGQSVTEREPGLLDRPIIPPHMKDWSLVERHAEGIVRVLLYGPRGDVNGAVLEDHTIVRVPPRAAYQVAALLRVGQALSLVGYGTENEYGRVIEATAMGQPGTALIPITDPGPGRARR